MHYELERLMKTVTKVARFTLTLKTARLEINIVMSNEV